MNVGSQTGIAAHQYALQARANCVKINAMLVGTGDVAVDPSARTVMQDYYQTACGWYSEVPPDGGRIITIGSVYVVTKAAVAGLPRGLACDLGQRNITVNTVQPCPVEKDMNPAGGPFAETLKGFMAIKRYARE